VKSWLPLYLQGCFFFSPSVLPIYSDGSMTAIPIFAMPFCRNFVYPPPYHAVSWPVEVVLIAAPNCGELP